VGWRRYVLQGNIIGMMKVFLSLLSALLLSGCSALVTHVGYTYDELTTDESELVHSRVYCGTKFNWEFQNTSSGGNIFGLFLLPDLLVSAAADTILFPFTWTHDALRNPTENGQ
jgi:uncharacterized protein YceK